MSDFTKQKLKNLEKLAKIKFTKEEEKEFTTRLKGILDYVDLLQEVDTDNATQCDHILKDVQQNLMREDEVAIDLSTKEFLDNAPSQIGGMIRILPVMKSEE